MHKKIGYQLVVHFHAVLKYFFANAAASFVTTLLFACAPMCPRFLDSKQAGKQRESKCCWVFGEGTLQQMVWSQNVSHWPAKTRANQLLCSADPGHVEFSDRSAAKKTDDGYQGKGCPCWLSSKLNVCDNDCYCMMYDVWWIKIELNPCVTLNSA